MIIFNKKVIKTELIENFIQTHKLSKTKFCKLCKMHPSTFNKIIHNDYNFRIDALWKIAKAINVPIYQLFE